MEMDVPTLEMPEDFANLLQRLKGILLNGTAAVEEVPYLETYDCFRSDGHQSTVRDRSRLEVLEALGKCRTLTRINIDHFGCLKFCEWEVFLTALSSNRNPVLFSVIHAVKMEDSRTIEHDAREFIRIGRLWGQTLKHISSLQNLEILNVEQNARTKDFLAGFVSGFTADTLMHPSLNTFVIDYVHDSRRAMSVARIVSNCPRLRKLHFSRFQTEFDEVAIESWSREMMNATELEEVRIFNSSRGCAEAVARAFSTSTGTSVLQKLDLIGSRMSCIDHLTSGAPPLLTIEETLPTLVTANIDHISLKIFSVNMTEDIWRRLGACICGPTILKSFHVDFSSFAQSSSSEWDDLARGLSEFWKTSWETPKLSLIFSFEEIFLSHSKGGFLYRQLTYFSKYSFAKVVHLHYPDFDNSYAESALGHITSENYVEKLTIYAAKGQWTIFFYFLLSNTVIKHLGLINCDSLSGGDFIQLMRVLEVNSTLLSIDLRGTPWEKDSRAEIVKAAVKENSKPEKNNRSIMAEANLPCHEVEAGRIFLCGSPSAGKTQLKLTMMKTRNRRSTSQSQISKMGKQEMQQKVDLLATTGIEVECLIDTDSVKLSIWDLGGHKKFRGLPNILFPVTSQVCVFLLVFSPFNRNGKNPAPHHDTVEAFSRDLKHWLRWIVSNTKFTCSTLPKVLVVITHRDKAVKDGWPIAIEDFEQVVREFRSKFKDVVDLCPGGKNLYHINGKSEEDVKPVTDYALEMIKASLVGQRHVVPQACSDLISRLTASHGTTDIYTTPVWSASKFYMYCREVISSLNEFSVGNEWGMKVLHAVATCLHDVGIIMMVPTKVIEDVRDQRDQYLIVLDPNWLTGGFLGDFLRYRQDFGMREARSSGSSFSNSDGEIGIDFLRDIQKKQNRGRDVDLDVMVRILEGLYLCYELPVEDGQPKFYVPIIFDHEEGHFLRGWMQEYPRQWSPDEETESEYFGYRIQCLDSEKAFLSSAFFPRYQVHLGRKIRSSASASLFYFPEFIEIKGDDLHFFVERDGAEGNHVDAMVKYGSLVSRDDAQREIQRFCVGHLIAFCASPEGCQGVRLVLSILETECVENFIPREYRDSRQAILVSDLTRDFEKVVMQLVEEGDTAGTSVLSYQLPCPSIENINSYFMVANNIATSVLDLTEVEDVLKIIQNFHVELSGILFDLEWDSTRLINTSKNFRNFMLSQLDPISAEDNDDSSNYWEDPERRGESIDNFYTDKMILGPHLSHDFKVEFKDLESSLHFLNTTLKDIKSTLQRIRSRMTNMNSITDRLIGYSKSMQKLRIPRRPYFTVHDATFSQDVYSMVGNNPIYLHLMCESRLRSHFLEDQPGMLLDVDNVGRIRNSMQQISAASLKMLSLMLGAGIQLADGMRFNPHFVNLDTELTKSLTDLNDLFAGLNFDDENGPNEESLIWFNSFEFFNGLEFDDQHCVEEAWLSIRDCMCATSVHDTYNPDFNLHLVRYKDREDPFAWLCWPCMVRERRMTLLEKD